MFNNDASHIAVSCNVSHVMLYDVMLHHVVLYDVMLCYDML